MLVLDASALAGWLMPDEAGVDLARQHPVFAAPWRLWAEIRNIAISTGDREARRGTVRRDIPSQKTPTS